MRNADFVFNLAGQISHLDSMEDPLTDFDLNARAHLSFLEVLRAQQSRAVVVYSSTRQLYGRPRYLPVDEEHPVQAVDVNGISQYAGEQFHLLYARVYGLRACSLRLTNVYGPRIRLTENRQGVFGVFLRRVLDDQTITVFGDGAQIRDFLYVDDVVEALLRAALTPEAVGEVFNVGHHEALSLLDSARIMVRIAGTRPGRAGAVAERPRRDRHRRLRERLRRRTPRPRLAAAHLLRRRRAPHDRVLPHAPGLVPMIPLVDLARRQRSLAGEIEQASARVLASGRSCSGRSSRPSRPSSRRGRATRTRSASARAPTRLHARAARRRHRRGRRGAGAGVHRGADRGRRLRGGRRAGAGRRRRRHRRHRSRGGARGVHGAHPCRHPGAPLRPPVRRRRSPTSACW